MPGTIKLLHLSVNIFLSLSKKRLTNEKNNEYSWKIKVSTSSLTTITRHPYTENIYMFPLSKKNLVEQFYVVNWIITLYKKKTFPVELQYREAFSS